MGQFKVRAYGKRVAKVMCGKEVLMECSFSDGTAHKFCKLVAEELERILHEALMGQGKFAAPRGEL